MTRSVFVSIVAALVMVVPMSAAQSVLEREVDAIVARQVTADGPGAAIAVVDAGKVVLLKGYGLGRYQKSSADHAANDVRACLRHETVHGDGDHAALRSQQVVLRRRRPQVHPGAAGLRSGNTDPHSQSAPAHLRSA